ncbi:MAG: class I SAM-dependent methyltransferase [Planctomycetota bacterium]
MLRISTQPSTENNSASGTSPESHPAIDESANHGPREWVDPIAGLNHGAQLVPWVTNELRFHSVIDLACGDGEGVRELISKGYEAHGIDIAPTPSAGAEIIKGDAFQVAREDGYYDLVMCANFAQQVEDHRMSQLLAEMHRLSNSYILISTPDDPALNRSSAWWCQRIADFNWQIRLLRQDPDTHQIVILAEKENSLASQILPLIDAGMNTEEIVAAAEQGSAPTSPSIPPSKQDVRTAEVAPVAASAPMAVSTASAAPALRLLDEALERFQANENDSGFLKISDMAHAIGPIGNSIDGLHDILGRLIDAMERRDTTAVVQILRLELRPTLDR